MKKILIAEEVPDFFINDLIDLGVKVDYFPQLKNEKLIDYLPNLEAIMVRSKIILNASILEQAHNLQLILRPGSGLDNIDTAFCNTRGIYIINSPEGNKISVAEQALGMLLSILNNIPKSFEEVKKGIWDRANNSGHELSGKTVGIIGFGNTGSAFAQVLAGLNVSILAYDKYKSGFGNESVTECDLEKIVSEADIISFHLPLSNETKHYFNSTFLDQLNKNVWIINTSRGKIIKTKALLEGIHQGKIKGACLDVLENEDLNNYTKDETEILEKLIATGKIIITPHVAGWTLESSEKIYKILIEKLKVYMDQGKILN